MFNRRLTIMGAFLPMLAAVVVACLVAADGPETAPRSIKFTEFLISNDYTYAFGVAAADLDGDGDLDLTSADALPHNDLYWFENDGKGNFTRHFIQEDDPDRLERHAIADINADGRPDVVIVENLKGDLKWFENSGSPRDGKLWKRHYITKGKLPSAYDVAPVDLDGDGDLDVAASNWVGDGIYWFENLGKEHVGEWPKHVIEEQLPETRTICAGDFDGDGDPDLLATARKGGQVIWLENSGKPATEPWKKHVVDNTSLFPTHGQPVDMDGDRDLDVVMALGFGPPYGDVKVAHQIVWYENDGKPASGLWKKHVIAEPIAQAFEAVAVDLDGDGDQDVVATGWGNPGTVVWIENLGDPRSKWRIHVLKDKWINANQIITADLNGDGRPDIIACAERGSLELRWWRNEGAAK